MTIQEKLRCIDEGVFANAIAAQAADEIDRLLAEVENWKINATCAADEVKTLNEEADELGVQIDRLTAELAASNAKLSECHELLAGIMKGKGNETWRTRECRDLLSKHQAPGWTSNERK